MSLVTRRFAERDPICKRLMTAPGVGPMTALAFRAAVDDPERFRRSRTVAAHFGLTPACHQSGEMDIQGRISKRGDGEMRVLIYEASMALLTKTKAPSWLIAWGLRLAKKRGLKRACVAVARRLATVLHRTWLDGTEFRWTKEAVAA